MRYFIYIGLLLMVIACNKPTAFPEFQQVSEKNYYKLITVGGGRDIEMGDYVKADLTYKTLDDSVFFQGVRKFQLTIPDYEGAVDAALLHLGGGDSAVLLLDTKTFFEKTLETTVPSFLQNQPWFKIQIKILKVQSPKEYQTEKQKFIGWIRGGKHFEKVQLQVFLNSLRKYEKRHGIYKVPIKSGDAPKAVLGDTIDLHYEGYFLDGKIFDSTWKRHLPLEFVYGHELQVIKGLEVAIGQMQEHERAMFILPSKMAFGEKGSSSQIIPPNTPVVFEVELIKIKRHENKTS